jgi:hypothetical protein
MSTKRTPLNRPQRHRFTPKAIELFKQILTLSDDDIFSTEYRRLNHELSGELKLRGFGQGCPVVIPPSFVPYYPPATAGGQWQRVEGPALFRELCAAADVQVAPRSTEEKRD